MSRSCIDKNQSTLLHAYELNMLSEREKDIFECHLFDCDFCFEQLKQFAPRGTILSASPLIREVLDEMYPQHKSEVSLLKRIWHMLWPEGVPAIVRPAVLLCVLLLMIYPAQLGIRSHFEKPAAIVLELSLTGARSPDTFIIPPDRSVVVSFVCPDSDPRKIYEITLVDQSGTVLFQLSDFSEIDSYGVGRLLLPGRLLPSTNYRLKVREQGEITGESPELEYIFYIASPATSK